MCGIDDASRSAGGDLAPSLSAHNHPREQAHAPFSAFQRLSAPFSAFQRLSALRLSSARALLSLGSPRALLARSARLARSACSAARRLCPKKRAPSAIATATVAHPRPPPDSLRIRCCRPLLSELSNSNLSELACGGALSPLSYAAQLSFSGTSLLRSCTLRSLCFQRPLGHSASPSVTHCRSLLAASLLTRRLA